MTRDAEHWDQRYHDRDLPWDTGIPESNLRHIITNHAVTPGPALELGCGTGTNAIWLAEQGFTVTAVDIAPEAIRQAKEKMTSDLPITYAVADILTDPLPGTPFDFVFDRGCLHSIETPEAKVRCVETIHKHMNPQGLWLSMIGSADTPPRDEGPPRLTAAQVTACVEKHFEILELRAACFDGPNKPNAPAWSCLMRRRE